MATTPNEQLLVQLSTQPYDVEAPSDDAQQPQQPLQILVDHREPAAGIKDPLRRWAPTTAQFVNLPVGDIEIRWDGRPAFLLERKTLADLAASIKDGRYALQLRALMQVAATTTAKVMVVIEGGPLTYAGSAKKIGGLPEQALVTCVLKLIALKSRERIAVVTTRDPADTVGFIRALATRVVKDPATWVVAEDTAVSTETDSSKRSGRALQGGDLLVKKSVSFGNSRWCLESRRSPLGRWRTHSRHGQNSWRSWMKEEAPPPSRSPPRR
jgi:ERCC4-type nuclease